MSCDRGSPFGLQEGTDRLRFLPFRAAMSAARCFGAGRYGVRPVDETTYGDRSRHSTLSASLEQAACVGGPLVLPQAASMAELRWHTRARGEPARGRPRSTRECAAPAPDSDANDPG